MAELERVRTTPWSSDTDREQLYVCLSGSAVLESARQSVTLAGEDLALVSGSSTTLRGECDVVAARFDVSEPAFLVVRSTALARAPELATVSRLLRAELASGAFDPRIAGALVESLAVYARRTSQPAPGSNDRRLARALEAMARDPARRWTSAELARACGLSRAAFNRRFAAATGTSPLRHLYLARMDLAARRLLESDDSLARIAADIGYESEFAFGKAFKRRFGVPPGAYRRSNAPSLCLAA
jgi:AraC-like DNA-binding protein